MTKTKRSGSTRSFKSWAKYGAASVLIILVLAWQAGVFQSKMSSGDMPDPRPKVNGETVKVQRVRLPISRQLAGTLMPREMIELTAKISGDVIAVPVQAGDQVKKGQVVMQVDPDIPEAQRAEAEAALEMAQAEFDGAEELLSHIEQAAAANALPEIEAIDARRVRNRAARAVDQRKAALEGAEIQLEYTDLTSPSAGVVVDTFRDPGDFVAPGRPVMAIYDPAKLEVVAPVPEGLVESFPPGREVRVVLQPLNQTVTGTVRSRVLQVDPATRTQEVKIAIEPPEGALPGMYAEVQFELPGEETLMIPSSAVGRLRGLTYVKIVDSEERIARRLIRLGRVKDDQQEVLAGLDEGDRVLKDYGSHE